MSDQSNKPSNGNTPTYHAYHVRDREGDSGFWTRIGSAWSHRDGKGINVLLDCTPIDGRISLRLANETPAERES